MVEVARTARRAPTSQPISAEIVNSERFKVVHDALAETAVLSQYSSFERLAVHKDLIREAARIVRNETITLDPA